MFDENPNLEQLLGIEKDEIIDKEKVEKAHDIYQIIQLKGWLQIEKMLNEMKENLKQHPEFYYRQPDLAGYHAGGLYVIQNIENFIEEQKSIINDPRYAEETKTSEISD